MMYNSALDFYFNHGEDWKKKGGGGLEIEK